MLLTAPGLDQTATGAQRVQLTWAAGQPVTIQRAPTGERTSLAEIIAINAPGQGRGDHRTYVDDPGPGTWDYRIQRSGVWSPWQSITVPEPVTPPVPPSPCGLPTSGWSLCGTYAGQNSSTVNVYWSGDWLITSGQGAGRSRITAIHAAWIGAADAIPARPDGAMISFDDTNAVSVGSDWSQHDNDPAAAWTCNMPIRRRWSFSKNVPLARWNGGVAVSCPEPYPSGDVELIQQDAFWGWVSNKGDSEPEVPTWALSAAKPARSRNWQFRINYYCLTEAEADAVIQATPTAATVSGTRTALPAVTAVKYNPTEAGLGNWWQVQWAYSTRTPGNTEDSDWNSAMIAISRPSAGSDPMLHGLGGCG